MRLGSFWFLVYGIHDLSCTWHALFCAARPDIYNPVAYRKGDTAGPLIRAAIRFVIQLSIEARPQDATSLRALETALIAKTEDA